MQAVGILPYQSFPLYTATMQPTGYPHINEVLNSILARLQGIFGEKLIGLYLYGSLVTGDYDDGCSDIDLLAATASDIDGAEFGALDGMHHAIVSLHRKWENRLEIAYLSLNALRTFKTQTSQIGIISPGEPFHIKEAGRDRLMNWYMVREKGVTLFGPPPQAIIEPVEKGEFIQTVKEHVMGWREWINDARSRPSQAYAILTMCRALYTIRTGEPASKIRAAAWAAKELRKWSTLIQNALRWRQGWRETDVDHEATLPDTRRFVHFVIGQVLG